LKISPNPVTARSKVSVCGHSLVGNMSSDAAEGMKISLLWVLCVVRYRYLGRPDHSSRGVLSSVVSPMSVIAKPRTGRPWPEIGSKSNKEKIWKFLSTFFSVVHVQLKHQFHTRRQ